MSQEVQRMQETERKARADAAKLAALKKQLEKQQQEANELNDDDPKLGKS